MRAEDVKYGPVYKFKDSEFYAASGSIVFHDNRKEGSCNIMSVDTFEFRAKALASQLQRLNSPGRLSFAAGDIEHRQSLQRLLHDMDLCIKDAKQQGDPMDPRVQRWFQKHQPWKGRRAAVGSIGNSSPKSYEINTPTPLPVLAKQGQPTIFTD